MGDPSDAQILLADSETPPSLMLHYQVTLSLRVNVHRPRSCRLLPQAQSEILEHAKWMSEVGRGRPGNWQAFLVESGEAGSGLEFLAWAACVSEELVGKALTGLLLDALAAPEPPTPKAPSTPASASAPSSARKSLSKIKADSRVRAS